MDTMKELLERHAHIKPPRADDILEGTIVGKGKASVFLDLGLQGVGIIYGKEFYESKSVMKGLQRGDKLFAKVLESENDEGYVEMSPAKAGKELAWDSLKACKDNNTPVIVKITAANKGGLIAEIQGIQAFLPVSQLSPANYPKVEGGDNQKILQALQKFVGKEMELKVFDLNPQEDKLILSERAKETEKIKDLLKNMKVGDVVEGDITGVVDFGAFIKFAIPEGKEAGISHLEGLIHISELDWQLIEDPTQVVKTGEKVKAKIIDNTNDKESMSLKALKQDPWKDIEKMYKKGDIVLGRVNKLNPFGAFVQILGQASGASMTQKDSKIQGLCHISEFGTAQKMEEALKVEKEYNFQILSIEPSEHRMSLKLIVKE